MSCKEDPVNHNEMIDSYGICRTCFSKQYRDGEDGEVITFNLIERIMKTSKISAASTVIMFLSEYIHGEVNGKREDRQETSLDNALDAIVRLYPNVKFVRPIRKEHEGIL